MRHTIDRRWGRRIRALGVYRDGVKSSQSHFVKCSGLRWICLMALTPISWADGIWALPFLTVLAPSERYHREMGTRHKTVLDWARQMIGQGRRWLPRQPLIIVGDGSYAALEFLDTVRSQVTFITRLRLDASLYEPCPLRQPRQNGRPRKKGQRLSKLEDHFKSSSGLKWMELTIPK